MKVTHVMTVPDSLLFLRGQARWMRDHGIDLEVVCAPGEEAVAFSMAEGVPVTAIRMQRAITPLADLIAVVRLVIHLRRIKPEVVHAHTPKGGLLGMIAAAIGRVSIRIYQVHGLPFETARRHRRLLLWLSEWASCHLATHVLGVSNTSLQAARAAGVCPQHKGTVVGAGSINGVDAASQFNPSIRRSDIEALRGSLAFPEGVPVIGFVGRVVRDKGVEELYNAWTEIREAHPDVRLLIVGRVEAGNAVDRRVLMALHQDDRVHVVGFVKDPAPYFGLMTVLAMPSHREGFGIAAIEAAAMCVPVVASDIPGLRDAVEDGVTGTLVPPRDPRELAAALYRCLKRGGIGPGLGSSGRRRVLREFDQRRLWSSLEAYYRESARCVGNQHLGRRGRVG